MSLYTPKEVIYTVKMYIHTASQHYMLLYVVRLDFFYNPEGWGYKGQH